MSTKIYDAWLLPEGTDIFEAAPQVRELLVPVRRRIEAAALVRTAVLQGDAHVFGKADEAHQPSCPLLSCTRILEQRVREHRDTEHGSDPFGCDVVFLRDQDTGRLVAKTFAEDPAFAAEIAARCTQLRWSDVHYQNRTDQPEDISEQDWEARRELWDRLLPGCTTFTARGVTTSITLPAAGRGPSTFGLTTADREAIGLAAIPDPGQRLASMALRYGLPTGASDPIGMVMAAERGLRRMKESGYRAFSALASRVREVEHAELIVQTDDAPPGYHDITLRELGALAARALS